ncbi:hypothetical protein TR51_22520 [Kitasatospora griseola]|uniref:Uncharacterized protein n=1 Tax=Kitasatospora griseola TaxID=2064 RepID=A0A0D0N1N9_KITGR|nr:hypothetical protein [Kitasatospora griseola]KIQ61990.1 hypothetical protein TR51_22520 [Kitasatospora griseola]
MFDDPMARVARRFARVEPNSSLHGGIVDLRAVDPSGNAATYRFDGATLTALGSHNLLTGVDTAPGGTTTAPERHPHKPKPHKPEPHKPEPHGH